MRLRESFRLFTAAKLTNNFKNALVLVKTEDGDFEAVDKKHEGQVYNRAQLDFLDEVHLIVCLPRKQKERIN